MDILNITNDGFYILLFLCPGYLGFRMYFIDRPWNMLNPLHVFYGSLVFSVVAYVEFYIVISGINKFLTSVNVSGHFAYAALATPFAVVSGLLWRCFGHGALHDALMKMKITNEDNNSTPWMQLFNNPKISLTQITVHLKNGSALRCDDTAYFDTEDLRRDGVFSHYTCVGGDIYMVANQFREKNDEEWQAIEDIHMDARWGLKIQWIPAGEIARVEVRATRAARATPVT